MLQKGLSCDGRCGTVIVWNLERGAPGLTKDSMEQHARNQGWHAPDKLGRHYCLNCRSRSGAEAWWRKENVRRGLPAGYGLDQCTCTKHGPGQELNEHCVAAGHPGVVSRL